MEVEHVQITAPAWRYVAHYEAEQGKLHYIEVARDEWHYGIERHSVGIPGHVPRVWFEYEGIYCASFPDALHQRMSTKKGSVKC